MSIEDIIKGESKNVEFKESRPENSIKYTKTVVAFANSTGGMIVFGVADETREIVGISDEIVFSEMDAITNAIMDSCAPAIVPDIYLKTVEGRTLIIVDVPIGSMRPYYIKSEGVEGGTYIRVSGTTRPADDYMIHELRLEGSHRSYDAMPCLGLYITDKDIDKLCKDMIGVAKHNCRSDVERNNLKLVTVKQLIAWGILIERDGKLIPTNAYAILTGNDMMPTTIQCGYFKGSTKAIFVDRTEINGPAWEVVEEAYRYVLKNIHIGARFEGIYRQDVYEIPPDAIRELIVNAVIHRSYLDHNYIQVAIYDDRLEIMSPGKLPKGQTLEKMQEGHSKIRNEALVKAFSYMKIIENWGSGILRVIQEVKDKGLEKPVFSDGEIDVIATIYRGEGSPLYDLVQEKYIGTVRETSQETSQETNQEKVVSLIRRNPSITQTAIARQLGISRSGVRYIMDQLQQKGMLHREGSTKKGKWILTL